MNLKISLFVLFFLVFNIESKASININFRQFGANDDGTKLNTLKLQAAIDSCYRMGGGTVVFPKGKYLTGTIVQRTNVTLHLEADAVLLGSSNLSDYKLSDKFLAEKNSYVNPAGKALIYAFGSDNISITGQGAIDGQGEFFEAMSRQESIPVFRGEAVAKKIYPQRPRLIEMIGCKNINIKSVQVKNSPSWGLHLIGCESVFIDQIRLDSHVRPNNDGIDIESCKTVFISNSFIYSDDDAICFKSSIDGLPVENVVVTNCILRSNCAAIKFGTPSAAGFKNIAVSNCTIYDCAQDAIKFMAVDGGIVEDISISNITMHNVEGPIFMRLGNMGRKVNINGFEAYQQHAKEASPVGIMRNIRISGITATMKTVEIQDSMLRVAWDKMAVLGILVTGIPGHCIEDVTFNDIQLIYPGGGTKEQALNKVPEIEDMYPEQHFFGILPSYGAYIRHARGIVFNNVRFKLASQDFRPAIVTDDVENLELVGVSAEVDKEAAAIVRMVDTRNVLISNCRSLTNTNVFLKLEGKKSGDVLMLSNDFRKVNKPFILDKNIASKEVRFK